MKAIVLAGGYATRLRPISYALPKLLFPVLGKPMIYWTLDLLSDYGVDEVVLCVNYLADSLRSAVGDSYRNMSIRYSLEETPLGTGGPMKLAAETVHFDQTFVAMNGDVIADIDLTKMRERHDRTNARVTDALHEVQDVRRFGVAQLDSESRITKFVEKPSAKEAPSRLANAGIYMISPEVLKMIPSGRKVSLEREIFPVLAREGKLTGFSFSGHWFDIGDLTDYRRANIRLLKDRAGKSPLIEKDAIVEKSAVLGKPSFVGEGAKIESRASVGSGTLIGKNSLIMTGARVSNSILFDDVKIGEGSVVSGAIIASSVTLGRKVRVQAGSILSPHVQIADGVRIGRNVIVHPHKEVNVNIKSGSHIM
jgi:NDP-sugar pyrophosphorylase family protein